MTLALSTTPGHMFTRLGIVASVLAISGLHYSANVHAVLAHEVLKRLYYVPIVVGAVQFGVQGGLATSLFASALYLPHIVLVWSRWPVFEIDQYGEVVLFNVVGIVTGVFAGRLRSQKNRYRRVSEQLDAAYQELTVRADERLKAERMAIVGRVAAGMAHEIRTPISAIHGCFEILAGEYPSGHPKLEFVAILKKEIARVENVVTTFLELARPALPKRRDVDVNEIARAAARRFTSAPLQHRAVDLTLAPQSILATVDDEQVERSIVELLTTASALAPGGSIGMSTAATADGIVEIRVGLHGLDNRISDDLFDTFDDRYVTHTLMLPLVRRLIEQQGGTISASSDDSDLRVVVALPASEAAGGGTTSREVAETLS